MTQAADQNRRLFVGLMSGTSADGVNAVLADFSTDPAGRLVASHYLPYDTALRSKAIGFNHALDQELDRAAALGVQLADVYAHAVEQLLVKAGVMAAAITAIGCHGQTVRHRPDLGYTIQLGNPARLAERTGVSVVADFRSRDMAAGGQGAPLAPGYHRIAFAHQTIHRVVLNLGGIANITNLDPKLPLSGFDTGPASCLMDLWSVAHLGTAHDAEGAWAASGRVDEALLSRLLREPYFDLAPPKSTGRDLFCRAWLDAKGIAGIAPKDVQASLLELTVATIAAAITRHAPAAAEIIVCGGGVHNAQLMRRLASALRPVIVCSSSALGHNPDTIEAMAFTWLARAAIDREPGNIASVTGARGPRVLGAIYPA